MIIQGVNLLKLARQEIDLQSLERVLMQNMHVHANQWNTNQGQKDNLKCESKI